MLSSAQVIGDHAEAALALASFAACANGNARETELLAVTEARRVGDAEARAFGLLYLIQYLGLLQREVAGEAAILTTQIPSANRPFILGRAVGYLEASAIKALLTAPPYADDSPWERDDWSASLVNILSPVLPDSLVPAALRRVQDIDDTPSRAKALGALAPRLPAPQRTELIADALDDIGRLPVGDVYWSPRSDALEGIARSVESTQFGESRELAEPLSGANDFGLSQVLRALAPRVAEMRLPEEALDVVASIDPDWRGDPLGAVIEHLPDHYLDRARSLVEPMTPARRRVAVVALAARLAHLRRRRSARRGGCRLGHTGRVGRGRGLLQHAARSCGEDQPIGRAGRPSAGAGIQAVRLQLRARATRTHPAGSQGRHAAS